MTTHTPFPWRYQVMGSEGCRIFPDTGDKREDIKYIAIVDGRDLPTNTANARLIAAAPDLLEACKVALSRLDLLADDFDVYSQGSTDVLRAAIAKAEGVKP